MHSSIHRCLATRRGAWGAIVVAAALAATGMVRSLAWADEAAEVEKPSSAASESSESTESSEAAPASSDGAPAADTAPSAESEPAPAAPAGEISKAPSDRPAAASESSGDAASAEEAPPAKDETAQEGAAEEGSEMTEEVETPREEEVEPTDAKPAGEDSTTTPEPSTDEAPGETPVEDETPPTKVGKKRIIGATANVLEKTSGFMLRARVDTGAKSCSMHVEKVIIENESQVMEENYGKLARILVTNGKDKEHWITARIESHVLVKTSVDKERRYKVPLTFRWKDCEKTVLVTLNDRSHMEFPLLLGRNFLAGDFIVDVELESND
jgi:hypothetical protein